MITERQQQILKIIIEQYIATAEPVGSQQVAAIYNGRKSATIRNECVVLEKAGYLEKVHKSSGRIPSNAGYRFYTKHLMVSSTDQIEQAKLLIKNFFHRRDLNVNAVLEQTSEIISRLFNVISVVIDQKDATVRIERVQCVEINSTQVVVLIILSNGEVQSQTFNMNNVNPHDLQLAFSLFNYRLRGTPVAQCAQKFDLIKAIMAQQIKNYELILQQFTEALLNISLAQQSIHGMQYLIANPEFSHPDKIKKIINFINNFSPFNHYQSEAKAATNKNDVLIKIGQEISNHTHGSEDLALISKTYQHPRTGKSTLAVIGPKRMAYSKITNLLM